MKQSKYNYLVEKDNILYCFNGISYNYIKSTIKQRENIQGILTLPEIHKDRYPSFYNTLIEGGFLVEDTLDELDIIRNTYKKAVRNKSCMLVILPTFNCNFRCWYCVQNHTSEMMSLETVEKVKKHISYVIENEDIQNLHIEWFGGEPFMCFNEVIEPISTYAKHLCEQRGIGFLNTATTNAYLITETIAQKLAVINFQSFQITLDGDKEHHNITRIAKNDSSFDAILRNINLICQYTKQANIIIRINYDNKNLNPDKIFDQINDAILPEYRKNIELLFRKVWQVKEVDHAEEKIKLLIKRFEKVGFRFNAGRDLVLNSMPCFVSQKGMRIISPNGMVGKCSAKEDFETAPLGCLQQNGSIKWTNDLPIPEIFSKPLFENKMCLSCKHLPVCMGPCPRDLNPHSVDTYKSHCKGRSNDLKFSDSIALWCESH